MTTSIFGISTGIDTEAILDAAIATQSFRLESLQTQAAVLNKKESVITSFNNSFDTLETTLSTFIDSDDPLPKSATSSNESVATATADKSSAAGTYEVNVTQKALANVQQSSGYSDGDQTVGEGTFSITAGTVVTDLTIAAGTTLTQLRDQINASGAAANAVVINDGSGGSDAWTLVISATETGDQNSVSIDTSAMTGATVPAFSEIREAQNAELELNGVAITRQSNVINDAVDGLQIDISGSTLGSTQLSVAVDQAGLESDLQTFVDAYNAVLGRLYTEAEASKSSTGAPDSGYQLIADRIRNTMSANLAGGSFETLSQIGLGHTADGVLTLDTSQLADAVNSDPEAVAQLFHRTDDSGILDQLDLIVSEATDPLDGTLALRQDLVDDAQQIVDDAITNEEDRLERQYESLKAQFAAMESLVAGINTSSLALNSLLFAPTPQS